MATRAQIEIYFAHKDTCVGNGIGQTQISHRAPEGVVSNVAGTNNKSYVPPGPRTADMPILSQTNVWMTWQRILIRGTQTDAGDESVARAWIFRETGQCPAIDDSFNLVTMQDEDVGVDPQGRKFRMENPTLDPDNAVWSFQIVRVR
jgi:hypothetical protein